MQQKYYSVIRQATNDKESSMHCAVSFTTVVELFNSTAKRSPISEFYGSKFLFFRELKFCFPWEMAGTSQSPAFGSFPLTTSSSLQEFKKARKDCHCLFLFLVRLRSPGEKMALKSPKLDGVSIKMMSLLLIVKKWKHCCRGKNFYRPFFNEILIFEFTQLGQSVRKWLLRRSCFYPPNIWMQNVSINNRHSCTFVR